MSKRDRPDPGEASSPKRTRLEQPQPVLHCPWKSSEIPEQLPPLPPLGDLEREVFRHPAFVKQGPSYERLEWIGDAFMEYAASCFIFSTFPDLPSGRCSQLRERLVNNVQLASYFREYDLMPKAHIPNELRNSQKVQHGRSKDKDLLKVQADMFEAYVGAIVIEDPVHGNDTAAKWLKGVWGRTIKAEIIVEEKRTSKATGPAAELDDHSNGNTRNPKEALAVAISMPGISIKYEDTPCKKQQPGTKLPMFAIKICLWGYGEAGRVLGYGSGINKKEAGTAAAAAVLANKKLARGLRDKKKEALAEMGRDEDVERLMTRTRYLDE